MVDLAYALNQSFTYTCPRCGSHNVEMKWDNGENWFRVICNDCEYKSNVEYFGIMPHLHNKWNIRAKSLEKRDVQPKEIVKQCVVRTNCRFHPKGGALDTALCDDWTVAMCNKISDGMLEYILEKKVKE